MRRKPARGFTLLELMVAAAVAMIAITAATATLVQQVQNQRDISKRNAIGVQLALAEVILDRQLSNAALGFADPRFAFPIRNNSTGSLPNGDATLVNAVAVGAAQAGYISGTDVLEIAWGSPTVRRGGRVVSCGSPSCNNLNGTGLVQLATTEPLTIAEATTLTGTPALSGPPLLFTDEVGASCLARASFISPGVTTAMTFTYLDADLAITNPPATNCPAAGMFVYGADVLRRYMVYQEANGANLGIYVQIINTTTLAWGAPTLLVGGIEDMQIRPRVATSLGVVQTCNDLPTSPTCTLSATNDYQVRSADIRLTVRGTQTLATKGGLRPLSYDHSAGTADDIYRTVGEFSVLVINSSLVNL